VSCADDVTGPGSDPDEATKGGSGTFSSETPMGPEDGGSPCEDGVDPGGSMMLLPCSRFAEGIMDVKAFAKGGRGNMLERLLGS